MDNLSIIRECLGALSGKRIIDIGCGSGGLAALLSSEGAEVVGVDVAANAITAAKRNAPTAQFYIGSASDLPFADHAFDATIFLNSLHHVPIPLMPHALSEGARVLARQGRLIVIEPLPEGSFFETFRSIEDETAIRLEAQAAIARFAIPDMHHERTIAIVRVERFASFEAFISRTTAADKSRLAIVEQNQERVRRAFETNSTRGENASYLFESPIKADLWTRHCQ